MPSRGPPSKSEQLDYLMQWFLEYSEVQRDDFLLVLITKFAPTNSEDSLPDAIKILNVGDHPPSIFQCRMKLFNEWFANWSDEEKTELLKRLTDMDDDFIQKFQEAIDKNTENGLLEVEEDEEEEEGEEYRIDGEEYRIEEELIENDLAEKFQEIEQDGLENYLEEEVDGEDDENHL